MADTNEKTGRFGRQLKALGACCDAIKWVGERLLDEAWSRCERGDWMLWLAAKVGVGRKVIVGAACQCARLALPHATAGETRPLIAIETAERWVRGEATLSEARKAAAAAYAAYAYAYAAAAAAATYAAASSDSDSISDVLLKCADIVRAAISVDAIRAGINGREP